ncbi:MAG: transketolase [Coriobacteriia bacterium]
MPQRGFIAETLSQTELSELEERARQLRGAILTMTSVAGSGHPGGSMSSLEMFMVVYNFARLDPERPDWPERDRVVVDHGHTSPGVYCALADAGFFDLEDAVAHFRQAESPFEGHVERSVPGIEWNTGNLGQGLSAAVGMAFASRISGLGWHTYCLMGDGGQHKGQVAEARRVAVHHGLTDITALVDVNRVQISGHTDEVMRVDIPADWAADGWRVIEVDGHDLAQIYAAAREARMDESAPVVVLCHTVIGKGVSFMEDEPKWHGAALDDEAYARAMEELGLTPVLEQARARRSEAVRTRESAVGTPVADIDTGSPRTYAPGQATDNRSAWGTALADIAEASPDAPIAVVDCDLVPSVKTGAFAELRPGGFIQAGIGEHNAAAMAGALSISGVLTFLADFGVFGVDEVYNQQRLNDINQASLKLVLTHCGLDVGEDGKTHQCLDYVGALRNFFGWKVVVPADPNQTDRAVRWAARQPGNVAIAMGRSKVPVITGEDGQLLFGGDYEFEYGDAVWARRGEDATVVVMGTVTSHVIEASDTLRAEGIEVGVLVTASPLELPDDAMRQATAAPVLVTAEDHMVGTGLGASVASWLALNGVSTRFIPLGVTRYASSGRSSELLRLAGLDAGGIAVAVRSALGV